MSFKFLFAWRPPEGAFASPATLSFIPQVQFMQVCSATVRVNTLWKWCASVEESVAPLTLFPPALEVNVSSYYFPPVSYTRWLPLEHESNTLSSSLRVCSFRRKKKTEKSPDSQEMKQTKVSASPPHMCLPDLQKEISNPPRTQCSERTELWYK